MNHNWEQWEYGWKTVDDDWTKEKDLKVNYRSECIQCAFNLLNVWVHMKKGVSNFFYFYKEWALIEDMYVYHSHADWMNIRIKWIGMVDAFM